MCRGGAVEDTEQEQEVASFGSWNLPSEDFHGLWERNQAPTSSICCKCTSVFRERRKLSACFLEQVNGRSQIVCDALICLLTHFNFQGGFVVRTTWYRKNISV
ncbi:unnamed protein product, partial [Closterium sp. NIES-64]